jgi:dienelactone hydrolase
MLKKFFNRIKVTKSLALLTLWFFSIQCLNAQNQVRPDTITVLSGKLVLKGLLWHPVGKSVSPAIIFCHGSYETPDSLYDPVEQVSVLGSLFAKEGYIFLGLFRRGTGLSKNQGQNTADLMANSFKEKGQTERNKIQIQQLKTADFEDIISGIAFLRQRKDVDTHHIAIMGHSFGGSLALLVAEHNASLKAIIIFGAAGYSWNLSPELREALINSVKKINAPIMIVHARNDYSVNAGYALDSVLNLLNKPHVLKIYPQYGRSLAEGHNIIFLSTGIWQTDVFKFLQYYFQ